MQPVTRLLITLFATLSLVPSLLTAEVRYTFTPLAQNAGLFQIMPGAINNTGAIVGTATRFDHTGAPFLQTDAGLEFLPDSLGWYGGLALNANHLVVGSGGDIAQVWENGQLTQLPPTGATWSRAAAINDLNVIAGGVALSGNTLQAYAWTKNAGTWQPTPLPDDGLSSSIATGIANSGRIIGQGVSALGVTPVVWDGTDPIALSVDWGWDGVPQALNEQGAVIGHYVVGQEFFAYQPFRWSGGEVTPIPLDGWAAGDALSINEHNQIVGWVASTPESNYAHRAALFEGDTILDLNTLIDPVPGWTLAQAVSINDAGQILGWAWQSVDTPTGFIMPQGFLLTPIPEPATALLLAAPLLVLKNRRRGHKRE